MQIHKRRFNKMIRPNKVVILLSFLILMIFSSSCKKFIEVNAPVTSTNAEIIYNDDAFAAAVLTGIYANMSSSTIRIGGLTSMSFFPSLSADELKLFSTSNANNYAYYSNGLTNNLSNGVDFWTNIYPIIFTTNSAIEGLNNSSKLTPSLKQQLTGEAKFMRAFCFFYLVNLYGDVPLITTTDYEVNRLMGRTPKAQVYAQIISDLKEAQILLSDKYLKGDGLSPYTIGSEERVRPTKWAATALLARAYLYTLDWTNAEIQSTAVIGNTSLFTTVSLNTAFLKNSKEAIWQLQPTRSDPIANTQEGWLYVLRAAGPNSSSSPVYLSSNQTSSFEVGDQRKVNWTKTITVGANQYTHPFKYKVGQQTGAPVTEYSMILRIGEQFLIRAEARAQLNNISGSQSDLNVIRTRAVLPNTTASDKASLLSAILHERQVELFTEWGHRWFDLKRTATVDAVMNIATPQKANGAVWQSYQQWYPILLSQLALNPNLVQNSGY